MIMMSLLLTTACQEKKEQPRTESPPNRVTIACTETAFFCYTIYVALDKGFFTEQGLEVALKNSYSHINESYDALLTGEADFAVSSETGFMHAVLRDSPVVTVASMITAENHLGVVARRDSDIAAASDLKGKKIAVPLGTNGEYFLDIVLGIHGMNTGAVQIINLHPNEMLQPLTKKEIDAVVVWNPYVRELADALGENAINFSADNLYSPSFLLVSTQEYVSSAPDTVMKVVGALINASEFIRKNRDDADRIVAHYLNGKASAFSKVASSYLHRITLDQSLLLILEHQSRWAIHKNITDRKELPNYLDHIYTAALETAKPENMTLIK
jgi:NitT/TauT family transport system substrate-binding protein